MSSSIQIDARDFGGDDPAAAAYNAAMVDGMRAIGWTFPASSAQVLRDKLASTGVVPYLSPRAEMLEVPSAEGFVPVRVIRAEQSTAVFVHCHSGGWVIGSSAGQDQRLEQIVERTGMTVVSVEYRLAPEHPFPAGLDDVEAVLRWALKAGGETFGSDRVLVGGESAGANLALSALLRVVRTDPGRVVGAALLYGNFDLGGTPSLLQRGHTLITASAMEWFGGQYLHEGVPPRHPEVSPLCADLSGLPHVLVAVGSQDALVDDSVFLAARLVGAGVDVELRVVRSAEHGFDSALHDTATEAVREIDARLSDWAAGG